MTFEEDEANIEAPLSPQLPHEEDEVNVSMDVKAPLSPQLPPSPPSPLASPDNILLYDPVE